MVAAVPRLLASVSLRSELDSIEARWLEADSQSRTASLQALRQYAERHRSAGPPDRLQLPADHPHRSEYSYDDSSVFVYVTLTVVRDGDQLTVESNYLTSPVSQEGGNGPPRAWSMFMSALTSEIENREGQGE